MTPGQEIWKPVMTEYLKRVPNTSFKAPPRRIEIGRQVTVPSLFGLGISGAIRKLEAAGFTVETQYVYHDTQPYGAFLGWSPGPGQTIAEFGTVYLTALAGQGPGRGRGGEARRNGEQRKRKPKSARNGGSKKPPPIVLPPGFPTPGPR